MSVCLHANSQYGGTAIHRKSHTATGKHGHSFPWFQKSRRGRAFGLILILGLWLCFKSAALQPPPFKLLYPSGIALLLGRAESAGETKDFARKVY